VTDQPNGFADRASSREKAWIRSIAGAYRDVITRMYCRMRFVILRQRFLEEIGQYLPDAGNVLDVGCGFGLFALYFAGTNPKIHVHGLDLNRARIEQARMVARTLGVTNVTFEVGDARDLRWQGGLDAVYMLDLIHHIHRQSARQLLERLADRLHSGGRLIVKDIDTAPRYKTAFTWLLDWIMSGGEPVDYWP